MLVVWCLAAVIIVLAGAYCSRNDEIEKDYNKAKHLLCDYLGYQYSTKLTVFQMVYEICYGKKEDNNGKCDT